MKNLKRTLSLVLAVALCFSLLTMGASARTYKDESSVTYKEAVQWLTTLGIMGGEANEDGTYSLRPTDPITRAEFSKLVCTLMNGGIAPSLGTAVATSFTDTQGHWAAAYIEFLVSLGYISGYGDGTFGPNDTITGQQAAKILLAVLQYNTTFENLTGATWAFKTDALASINGLYTGLKNFASTNLLKREEAAQMIYNALDSKIIEYIDAGNAGTTSKKGDLTLEQYYFSKIKRVEGVVVANSYGSMIPGGTATDDVTYIVSVDKLKNDGIENITLADCVSFDGDVTTADMLGCSVRFAYVENLVSGSTKKELVNNISVTEYNKTFTTTAGGSIREATVGMKLDCEAKFTGINENTGLKGYSAPLKKYTTRVYKNFEYVENGTELNDAYDYLRINTTSNFNYINAGSGWTTQVIDYNGDGNADFVKVYTATPYKATYISSAGIVTLKNLSSGKTIPTSYDKANFINKDDGKVATIEKDDVFLATIDEANSKVYVSPLTSFTGTITGVSSSLIGPNSSYTVYVDGTAYKVHDITPNLDGSWKAVENQLALADGQTNMNPETDKRETVSNAEIDVDTFATFYKDANGVLCYIDPDAEIAESNVKFGLVTYAGDYDIGSDGQYIKLVASDGTESVKSVTTLYDGTSFEDVDKVNKLDDPATPYIIAYTTKADGSLKAYKMADLQNKTKETLNLDGDTAKIYDGTAVYQSYLLNPLTVFVNAEDNLAFTGYKDVPKTAFAKAGEGVLYIITANDVYAAQNKLGGGKSSGSTTTVKFMFYTGATASAAGDDIYFYIPNAGSYSSGYASDGTTRTRTYRAIVNGVVDTAFTVNYDNFKPTAKMLYVVDKYDSDGKTIKAAKASPINLTPASTDANTLDELDRNSIEAGGMTYVLTDSTVYINVTASTNFETVTWDYLTEGYKVYVTYDDETYEALQVYITKVETPKA